MLIVCPSCASQYTLDAARIGPAGRPVRCAACREPWFVPAPGPSATEEATTAEAPSAPPAGTGSEPASGAAAQVPPPLPPLPPLPEAAPGGAPDASPGTFPPSPPPAEAAPDRTLEAIPGAPPPASRRRPRAGRRKTDSARRPPGARVAILAASLLLALLPAALASREAIVRVAPASAVLFETVGLPVNLLGFSFRDVASRLDREGTIAVLTVEGTVANVSGRDLPVPALEIGIAGEDGRTLYHWAVKAAADRLPAGGTASFRARLASPPPAGRRVEVSFRPSPPSAQVASR